MTDSLKSAVRILEDRLALALIHQPELMQGINLLPGRGKDRNTLRDDPGYRILRRMVRRMLNSELQKLEAEKLRKEQEAA